MLHILSFFRARVCVENMQSFANHGRAFFKFDVACVLLNKRFVFFPSTLSLFVAWITIWIWGCFNRWIQQVGKKEISLKSKFSAFWGKEWLIQLCSVVRCSLLVVRRSTSYIFTCSSSYGRHWLKYNVDYSVEKLDM